MAKTSGMRKTSQGDIEWKKERERAFILDGTIVSKLSNDETDRNTPSLDFGIPQYNALKDPHCKGYFKSKALPKKLKPIVRSEAEKSSTEKPMSTMQGHLRDEWLSKSKAIDYVENRKDYGGGYTHELYAGHLSMPTGKPTVGYHGEGGYRRNTFDLRRKPSVFGDSAESKLPPLKPNTRQRTMSAPPKMQTTGRMNSARVYSAKVRVPRAQSAMPKVTASRGTHSTRPVSGVPSLPEEPENFSNLDVRKTTHAKESSFSVSLPNDPSSSRNYITKEERLVSSNVGTASIEEETRRISLGEGSGREVKGETSPALPTETNPICAEETIENISEE